MTGKLTAQQQRFVREYLIDLDATQAVTRAGYPTGRCRPTGGMGKTVVIRCKTSPWRS